MRSCQLPFSRGFPYASLPPLCLLADLCNFIRVCHVGRGPGCSSSCRSSRPSGYDSCRSGKSASPFSRRSSGTGRTGKFPGCTPTGDDSSRPRNAGRARCSGYTRCSRCPDHSPGSPDDHSRTAQPDGSRGTARWYPPGCSRRQNRCQTGCWPSTGSLHPADCSHEGQAGRGRQAYVFLFQGKETRRSVEEIPEK
jgi:hypothetical protein